MTEMYLASNDSLKSTQVENQALKNRIKGLELEVKQTTKNWLQISDQRNQLTLKVRRQERFLRHVVFAYENQSHIIMNELEKANSKIDKMKRSKKAKTTRQLNTAFSEHYENQTANEFITIVNQEITKDFR